MKSFYIYSIQKDEFFQTITELFVSLGARIVSTIEESEGTIVLGGDGAVLGASRSGVRSPMLIINTGHLGFLTSSSKDDYHKAIINFLTGRYTTTKRQMLIVSQDGEQTYALNDIVFRKAVLSGLVRLSVYASQNDQAEVLVSEYRADGLIVSTPTGSTAYNLSASGPIIHPSCPSLVITPICPQALTQRPVVLPASFNLRIEAHTEDMGMSIDGQIEKSLGKGVNIQYNQHAIETVDPITSYFEVLRSKMAWGIRPV